MLMKMEKIEVQNYTIMKPITNNMTHKLIKTGNYLLVVDDSVHPYDSSKVGNPLAHLSLNGSPVLEGVDLLPPYSRHQEDGLDDAVMSFKESWIKLGVTDYELSAFSEGYNEAREKYKYTEEDMRKAISETRKGMLYNKKYEDEYIESLNQYPTKFDCEMEVNCTGNNNKGCFMHSPAINCGCVKPKTVTTAQGVQWVGKYK